MPRGDRRIGAANRQRVCKDYTLDRMVRSYTDLYLALIQPALQKPGCVESLMADDNKLAVHLVAGARPNFMKVAPLYHALANEAWCRPVLVNTGQHYDVSMSDAFIRDLGLPSPDHHLGIGGGTHAQQTARVMIAYETLCLNHPPDWIVVVGDVDSTLACALVAAKLRIPLAHLEAGLRSRDRSMPEEINRIVTDAVADLLWTPSKDADENLLREGISPDAIDCVGNIMIDSFELVRDRIRGSKNEGEAGIKRRPTMAWSPFTGPST